MGAARGEVELVVTSASVGSFSFSGDFWCSSRRWKYLGKGKYGGGICGGISRI